MTRMKWAVLAGCLVVCGAMRLAAQAPPQVDENADWARQLKARHDALVAKRGTGTDAALRDRLLKMGREDQAAPERGLAQPRDADRAAWQVAANARAVDKRLTEEMKGIVAREGWPTIAMVGIDASNAAMLIVAHTPDHAWQVSLLPMLERLASIGQIDGSMVALIVDKELVAEHKLQRYGTQFKFVDGQAMMYAVEDPQGLEARRAQVFLPPMPAYKKMLAGMYHLQVSDMIVRP